MVFFNWATMQMAAKIVYYGPGLCGKTSNLSYIYAKTAPTSRGEMVSLETESDRTLFFDLLPLEVGTIGGFKTRLQLYTVPGQVFYNTTRKLVLKGVDGVVFVADSQRPMREANLESFASLRENLRELGLEVEDIPLVLQFNKRDLHNILTVEELNQDLNSGNVMPCFESSAITGEGVFETLKEITKLTLKKLRRRMAAPHPAAPRPRPTPSLRPATLEPQQRPSGISAAALARAAEEAVDQPEVVPSDAAPEPAPPTPPPAEAVAERFDAPAEGSTPEPPAEPFEVGPTAGGTPEAEEASPEGPTDTEVDGEVTTPMGRATIGPVAPFGASERAPELPTGEAGPEDRDEVEVLPEETEVPRGEVEVLPEEAELPADEAEVLAEETEASPEEPEPEEVAVEFDKADVDLQVSPPPMKRVQVSNQMDILAELEDLRKQATMSASTAVSRARPQAATPVLDLDSLIGVAASRQKEVRRKLGRVVNSDVFEQMKGLQVAIRLQDAAGETIHTLDPILLSVEECGGVERLSLLLSIDLENKG